MKKWYSLLMLAASLTISFAMVAQTSNPTERAAAAAFAGNGLVGDNDCQAMAIPYLETFENCEASPYTGSGNSSHMPDCWYQFTPNSTSTMFRPHVFLNTSTTSSYTHSGSKCLLLVSNNQSGEAYSYVLMPEMAQPLNQLQLRFWLVSVSQANNGTLTVGYVTGDDYTTFTAIETYLPGYPTVYMAGGTEIVLNLTDVPANAKRIAFKWAESTEWGVYLDDINLVYAPTCSPIEVTSAAPYSEGFEGGVIPTCWTQGGNWIWTVRTGDEDPNVGAYSGSYNMAVVSNASETPTWLITPQFNLSNLPAAQLSFWHLQRYWSESIPLYDTLTVYYRTTPTAAWTQLARYGNMVETWTEEVIQLPNLSATYQIAFVSSTGSGPSEEGRGVAIDDVTIEEVNSSNCPPAQSIAAEDVWSDQVDLHWIGDPLGGVSYELRQHTAGQSSAYAVVAQNLQAQSTGDVNITVDSLLPNTEYTFSVVALCGFDDGDSILSTPAYVTVTTEAQQSQYVTFCDSYMWHDTAYTTSGTYYSRNDELHLTINQGTTTEITHCADTEYVWYGDTYTAAGDYTHTFVDINGCDSVEVLHLSIGNCCQPVGNLAATATISTVTLTWDDQSNTGVTYSVAQDGVEIASGLTATTYTVADLTEGTTYTFEVTSHCSATGTSEPVSINVTTACQIIDTLPYVHDFEENAFQCYETEGVGQWLSYSGDAHGGDRSVTAASLFAGAVSKLVTPQFDLSAYDVVVLTFWYKNAANMLGVFDMLRVYYRTSTADAWHQIFAATEAHQTWTEAIVNLPTNAVQVAFEMVDDNGMSVHLDDISLDVPSCFPVQNLTATTEVSTVTLSWSDPYNSGATYSIAQDGVEIAADLTAMTYTIPDLALNSEYTFAVTTHCSATEASAPVSVTAATAIVACDSYSWHGRTYYSSGTYYDGAETLNLVIRHSSRGSIVLKTCESYSWYGHTDMTTSQKVRHTFEGGNAEGCDSTVILNLHIVECNTTTVTACDSYTWKGRTYTSSGTYHSGRAVLNLTINHSTKSDTIAETATAYTWYEYIDLVAPQNVSHTFVGGNAAGCDSTVTLHLMVADSSKTSNVDTIVACDSVVWQGITLSSSGLYVIGPDTLLLTINNSSTGDTVAEVCNTFDWYEYTDLTDSADVPHTFVQGNTTGCDSTVTLHLYILPCTSIEITTCDSIEWQGNTLTSSGVYNDDYDTIHLTVNYSTAGDTVAEVCNSFSWYEYTDLTASADVPHTFTQGNAVNCDSTVMLHLTVNQCSTTEIVACDSYVWNDDTLTVSDTYINGMDTLILVVNYSTTGDTAVEICSGYSWYEHVGMDSTQEVTHIFEGANAVGCDSIVTLHLTINDCCMPVQDLDATVNSTSVILTWSDVSNGNATYTVEQNGVAIATDIAATTYTVTGLSVGTEYTFAVTVNCTETRYSDAMSITVATPCIIDVLPYVQDFENAEPNSGSAPAPASIVGCVVRLYDNPNQGRPNVTTRADSHSGTKCLDWFCSNNELYQIVALPEVNTEVLPVNTLLVRFWTNKYTVNDIPAFTVGVMTDPMDANTFVPIGHAIATGATENMWCEMVASLEGYSGEGRYVAIRTMGNGTSSSYAYVDDITLDEVGCHAVQSLTATPSASTVTLIWRDALNDGASYTVTQNGEVVATGISNYIDGVGIYRATGLTMGTEYTFTVTAHCVADEASVPVSTTVTTDCSIEEIPYVQDFETAETNDINEPALATFASCMTRLYSNPAFGRPGVSVLANGGHSGDKVLDWVTLSDEAYQIVVLPQLNTDKYPVNTLGLHFWAYGYDTTEMPTFTVGVMTDPMDANTFVAVGEVYRYGTTGWVEYAASLESYNGEGRYVAIRTEGGESDAYAYVDDITLNTDQPVLSVEGADIAEWRLYPNPASTMVTVDAAGMTRITLFDAAGRELERHQVAGSMAQFRVDNLADGVYYFRIESADHVAVKKCVVRH